MHYFRHGSFCKNIPMVSLFESSSKPFIAVTADFFYQFANIFCNIFKYLWLFPNKYCAFIAEKFRCAAVKECILTFNIQTALFYSTKIFHTPIALQAFASMDLFFIFAYLSYKICHLSTKKFSCGPGPP